MLDLDHFKTQLTIPTVTVTGDESAQTFCAGMPQNGAGDDIIGRTGGEEFAILPARDRYGISLPTGGKRPFQRCISHIKLSQIHASATLPRLAGP